MKASLERTFSFWLVLITALAWVDSASAGIVPDLNFRAPFFAASRTAARTLLLPDGRFFLFYNTDTLTDQRTGAITRYLPNGTLDTSFNFSRNYKSVLAAAPADNGQLYVAAVQYAYGPKETEQILRLNTDGSIDLSFNEAIVPGYGFEAVEHVRVQSDGKLLVAGFFLINEGALRDGIFRLLADGTVDSSFATITIGGGFLYSVALQPDGKILIGGNFNSVNDVANRGVARLNADGSLDSSFQGTGFTRTYPVRALVVQNDAKIIMAGRFNFGSARAPLFRLNADGSRDTTFTYVTNISNIPNSYNIVLQPDEKAVATVANSIYRFNTDGSLDSSFRQPVLLNLTVDPPIAGTPFTVGLQADGRVLFGGAFADVDPPGLPSNSHFGVARLDSNGTLDSSLTTSHKTGFETTPDSFARLADGSTLIAFKRGSKIDPAIPYNLGRLLPDGSRDLNFSLSSSNPNSFLSGGFLASGFDALADGSFLVVGMKADSTFAYGKVLPTGVEDTVFVHDPATPTFQKARALPDGMVLLSAGTDDQSTVEATLSRLQADGQVDGAFQVSATIRSGQVLRDVNGNLYEMYVGSRALAVQPDGKILFEYLASDQLFHLVRLNADGSIDGGFAESTFTPFDLSQNFPVVYDPIQNVSLQPPNGVWKASFPLLDAQIQSDGHLVIVGQFKLFNGVEARGLVRLQSNGAIDNTFDTGGGAQWTQTVETATFFPFVSNIVLQADGRLLITGTFEAFNGVAAPGIANLTPNGSVDMSFVAPAIGDKHSFGNILARQPDGSFLLSGAYTFPNETISPSFIRLLATIDISGTISYCSSLSPVPNVTMTLTGASGGSTLTNGSGNYTFSSLVSGGDYTVTPTKAALAPASPGINTVDVIAIQRHILLIGTPLSGCRLTAADVNGIGGVNTVDVVAVQRFALALTTGIASTGQYRFTPASRTYPGVGSDQPAQNYDALVLGDVATGFVHRPEGGPSQDGR